MPETFHLGLPYLAAAQAQKHVTHNEALLRLDAVVQLAVVDASLADPPASPAEGDRYIVAAGAAGAWEGRDGEVAAFLDGAWTFVAAGPGWVAFDRTGEALLVRHDDQWQAAGTFLGAVARLGVNTAADDTNRLAVRSSAALFTAIASADGGSGDMRVAISKEAEAGTASLILQSGFSARGEVGLAGDDDLVIKVSADGAAWTEAVRIDKETGLAAILYDNSGSGLAATTLQGAIDELATSGGGVVSSVFGRTGTVAAAGGDYAASQVDNDSGATGASVADALDALDTAKLDKSGGTMTGAITLHADPSSALHPATKQYVDQIVAAQDAMVFKGVVDCSANPNYPAADRGHTYRVSVAGRIGGGSGPVVEAGDVLLCLTDGTLAGNHATVGAQWSIAQANLDGAVIGPASVTSGHVATFSGTTGKIIQSGGKGLPSGAVVGTTDAQTLTNKTLTSPVINSPTGNFSGRRLKQIARLPSSTTYNTPAGVTALFVRGVGGGGAGGSGAGSGSGSSAAAGGSAGAYGEKWIGSPAGSYAVTIGAAGSPAAPGNNTGGAGGTSSFGSELVLGGGPGGPGQGAATAGGQYSGTPAAGAVTTGGDLSFSGQAGTSGLRNASSRELGRGGSSPFGTGGRDVAVNNVTNAITGIDAIGFGAGGGGGGGGTSGGDAAGGAGAAGYFEVWEFVDW